MAVDRDRKSPVGTNNRFFVCLFIGVMFAFFELIVCLQCEIEQLNVDHFLTAVFLFIICVFV